MPHSRELAVEKVSGGGGGACPLPAPVHTFVHTNTDTRSCSQVGKHGGDQALGSTRMLTLETGQGQHVSAGTGVPSLSHGLPQVRL